MQANTARRNRATGHAASSPPGRPVLPRARTLAGWRECKQGSACSTLRTGILEAPSISKDISHTDGTAFKSYSGLQDSRPKNNGCTEWKTLNTANESTHEYVVRAEKSDIEHQWNKGVHGEINMTRIWPRCFDYFAVYGPKKVTHAWTKSPLHCIQIQ